MSSRPLAALALAALATLTAGCPPTCTESCAKLDDCGINDDVSALECETACRRELAAYKDDGNLGLEEAFDVQRRCVGSSTCEEIELGECFDEKLFPFDLTATGS